MKFTVMSTVLALSLMAFSLPAEAGGNRYGFSGHHYSHGHPARIHHRYSHQRYRHRHHGHRHDLRQGLKIAAGALLLGSVIHAATDHRRDRVVVRRTVNRLPDREFWYRRDYDGACVEVTLNSQGQEVWTYVDETYCE